MQGNFLKKIYVSLMETLDIHSITIIGAWAPIIVEEDSYLQYMPHFITVYRFNLLL